MPKRHPTAQRRIRLHRVRSQQALPADSRNLHDQEQWLSLAVDPSLFAVWINDLRTDTIHATGHWYVLLDIDKQNRPRLDTVVQRMHPDDRLSFKQARNGALAGGGSYATEFRIVLPDGSVRWIASRGRAELDAEGQAIAMRGVSIDISANKRIELESQQRLRDLTHMARVSMLGGLSGAMAHELNQPLTAILSNAQAAQRFLAHDEVNLDEIRVILADIVSEDRRAGEVIRRLRMLLSPAETQRELLDVNELVSEVFKLLRSHLVNQQVSVNVDLAATLPAIHADRVQLQQVLINLVMNACDALRAIALTDRKLSAQTRLDPDGVCVSIIDQGCGIAELLYDRLFTSFATTKPGGMGLGLSVCRSIVRAHGGEIWADKPQGDGASFHFRLPLPSAQEHA